MSWRLSPKSGVTSLPQCQSFLGNHRLQSAGCLPAAHSSHRQSELTPSRAFFHVLDEKQDNKHNSATPPILVILFCSARSAVPHHSPQSPLSLQSHLFCRRSQTDRAVQLLLETSADNSSYYCDSLKACLVTTITSSGPSQSTIKLVATNMIANGKLAGSVPFRLAAAGDFPCFLVLMIAGSVYCVGVCSLESA